jgi:very-short-patch-repair endonuclease
MSKPKIIRSAEYKEKQRQSHIGQTPWNKGMPMSEEQKEKLRQAQLKTYINGRVPVNQGKHFSEETKQKLRESKLGNKFWLGKHHTEKTKKKIGLTSLGRHNKSNIGRHLSEEHKQHIRQSCKGINTGKRPPFSEDWRRKLGLSNKGKHIQFSEEHRKNLALSRKKSPKVAKHLRDILHQIPRISKPQKELYFLLKQIFGDATLEYPIQTKDAWRFADIGVPSLKLDFEYDGKHWHENKKERDDKRDKELAEVGWVTFRVNSEILKVLLKQPIFMLRSYL